MKRTQEDRRHRNYACAKVISVAGVFLISQSAHSLRGLSGCNEKLRLRMSHLLSTISYVQEADSSALTPALAMCVCRRSFPPDYCNFALVEETELKKSTAERENVEDKTNGDDGEEARSDKKDKNRKDSGHTKNA